MRTNEQLVMSRRAFLGVSTLTAGAAITGCATNPVTGRRQLMLLSTSDEMAMDRQYAPHQFSADFGAIQNPALQRYLQDVTDRLIPHVHRPDMPYGATGLHASYVNGYTFPAGTMGLTRGILAELPDEAALAALIGHEMGHVNARHAARRMTSQVMTMLVIGLGAAVLLEDEKYAPLVLGIGAIGAGALLARYSRENEREADALGMEYMVAAGYAPVGMVSLMDVLRSMQRRKPNALEMMFATHPMSEERYQTAIRGSQQRDAAHAGAETGRARYMDMTASIRAQKSMLSALQDGDSAMRNSNWQDAEDQYARALRQSPDDYEGLLKMAQCRVAQEKLDDAAVRIVRAREVYPTEPLSYQLGGLVALRRGRFEEAHRDFTHYLSVLPGNPLTVFYNGRSLEGMGRKEDAAAQYKAFLQQVSTGDEAAYARKRLAEWGMA
ncbi:MAG: M48 family metalloprotease [Kiritimatiellia bacterium]